MTTLVTLQRTETIISAMVGIETLLGESLRSVMDHQKVDPLRPLQMVLTSTKKKRISGNIELTRPTPPVLTYN